MSTKYFSVGGQNDGWIFVSNGFLWRFLIIWLRQRALTLFYDWKHLILNVVPNTLGVFCTVAAWMAKTCLRRSYVDFTCCSPVQLHCQMRLRATSQISGNSRKWKATMPKRSLTRRHSAIDVCVGLLYARTIRWQSSTWFPPLGLRHCLKLGLFQCALVFWVVFYRSQLLPVFLFK